MPNPSVMPCTKPNRSAVTAAATATPSSTGTAIAASTQGERNRHSSRPATSAPDARVIRRTSSRIAAAVSRANTAGAGQQQPRRDAVPRRIERPPHRAERRVLRRQVQPGGPHADQQQRARRAAGRGEPDAGDAAHPAGPGPAGDQRGERAGRIGQPELRAPAARPRIAARPAAPEIPPQRRHRERRRVGRRRQQVAAGEQGGDLRLAQHVAAVLREFEPGVGRQGRRHAVADAGQLGLRTPLRSPARIRLAAAPERSSSSISRAASVRPCGSNSVMSLRTGIQANTAAASSAEASSAAASGQRRGAAPGRVTAGVTAGVTVGVKAGSGAARRRWPAGSRSAGSGRRSRRPGSPAPAPRRSEGWFGTSSSRQAAGLPCSSIVYSRRSVVRSPASAARSVSASVRNAGCSSNATVRGAWLSEAMVNWSPSITSRSGRGATVSFSSRAGGTKIRRPWLTSGAARLDRRFSSVNRRRGPAARPVAPSPPRPAEAARAGSRQRQQEQQAAGRQAPSARPFSHGRRPRTGRS